MSDFEKIYNIENLYNSFRKIQQASSWKERTQRYDENLMENLIRLSNSLKDKTYQTGATNSFIINERGKLRFIESLNVDDRIVHRCLIDNIITPKIEKYLVYDNSASLKGKGTDFFRKRFEHHLRSAVNRYGLENCYILKIDFKKFFDNIRHDKFIEIISRFVTDEDVLWLIKKLIENNKVDVSYMNDEQYSKCMDNIFNQLEYNSKISEKQKTGEKYMYKSFGIGGQLSQIAGILYPYNLDNWCKIVKGMRYYGRYMDDSYIIYNDKEFLWNFLKEYKKECEKLGIFVNDKKTCIIKLTHKFTMLKVQYKIMSNGYIIKVPSKDTFTRERRRLKKYKKKVEQGNMDFMQVKQSFDSWKGGKLGMNCRKSVEKIDLLFKELFKEYCDE